jgi:hypothetical protein
VGVWDGSDGRRCGVAAEQITASKATFCERCGHGRAASTRSLEKSSVACGFAVGTFTWSGRSPARCGLTGSRPLNPGPASQHRESLEMNSSRVWAAVTSRRGRRISHVTLSSCRIF